MTPELWFVFLAGFFGVALINDDWKSPSGAAGFACVLAALIVGAVVVLR